MQIYKTRLKKLLTTLKLQKTPSILVVSTASLKTETRDCHFPFQQSSDFFYLTGSSAIQNAALVASSVFGLKLISQKKTALELVWDGPTEDPKILAKSLDAELELTDNIQKTLKELCKKHETLFFQNEKGSIGQNLASSIFTLESHERGLFPITFSHVDKIIGPMRLIKDNYEVKEVIASAKLCHAALRNALSSLKPNALEKEVAKIFQASLIANNATCCFKTIVGAGASASILHYSLLNKKIKSSDLVLIDCGARLNSYCSDVSRTYPASGKFSSSQLDLYNLVLESQLAAIKKVKSGVKIKDVYMAAAKVLINGLVDMKILKGSLEKIIKNKEHLKYFPHGIGHSLGIDVHDVGGHRGNLDATLEENMVFTIEPGLYFSKKIGKFSACGIRIEDDILVTKNGSKVLTDFIPKTAEAVVNEFNECKENYE